MKGYPDDCGLGVECGGGKPKSKPKSKPDTRPEFSGVKKTDVELVDFDSGKKPEILPASIEVNGAIYIQAKGYGDCCSNDGYGTPVFIEWYDGELRVVVFGDINQEDPTHIISLEGAREDKRIED